MSSRDGFSKDVTAYLVGSVLTVTTRDVVITALAAAGVVGVIALMHKELAFPAFDRDGAEAAGLPVARIDLLILVLVQITLVVAVPTVGTILSVALLVTPAATARLWTDRFGTSYVTAAGIGAGAGAVGLAASQVWDTAAGATIALVAGAAFAGSIIVRRLILIGGVQ